MLLGEVHATLNTEDTEKKKIPKLKVPIADDTENDYINYFTPMKDQKEDIKAKAAIKKKKRFFNLQNPKKK